MSAFRPGQRETLSGASNEALSRRTFLGGAGTLAVLGATGASVANASPAHAQSGECPADDSCEDLMVVWRLDPDWGYPRGPHGKTQLESNASRNAAMYRWALTEQDALDMNLHLCSHAPAIPVVVRACPFMKIWDADDGAYDWQNPWLNEDVTIFDERCLPHISNGASDWAAATEHDCEFTPDQVLNDEHLPAPTTTTTTTTTTVPGKNTGSPANPTSLAFTGSTTQTLAGIGALLGASGAALEGIARRRHKIAKESLEATQNNRIAADGKTKET